MSDFCFCYVYTKNALGQVNHQNRNLGRLKWLYITMWMLMQTSRCMCLTKPLNICIRFVACYGYNIALCVFRWSAYPNPWDCHGASELILHEWDKIVRVALLALCVGKPSFTHGLPSRSVSNAIWCVLFVNLNKFLHKQSSYSRHPDDGRASL